MTSLWPWLAVAGAGALHGLNPCAGWLLAARCGRVRRALALVALGHAASIGVLAFAVSRGMFDRGPMAWTAAGLMVLLAASRWKRSVGLALSSFITATFHGTGLMLAPALVPMCLGDSPAKAVTASGSGVMTVLAVLVHLAAMLAVTGVMAMAARAAAAHGGSYEATASTTIWTRCWPCHSSRLSR